METVIQIDDAIGKIMCELRKIGDISEEDLDLLQRFFYDHPDQTKKAYIDVKADTLKVTYSIFVDQAKGNRSDGGGDEDKKIWQDIARST